MIADGAEYRLLVDILLSFSVDRHTHTHPALAGSRIKRNIRVTNERECSQFIAN